MSDVKAIPRMLNLSSRKPTTVEAFVRSVSSIATNAQSFGPNTYANIVLDTSTPGAFLDPNQSFIEFDFEVTNTNPYIDYMNLSAAGMASFIEEFRIYNQGTPIEEILQYNLMFEHWMKMGGHAQTKFRMFMENSWRAPVLPSQSDLNFVKPPMVDREGLCMHPTPVNMFGDGNTLCQHNEQGNYRSARASGYWGLNPSEGVNYGWTDKPNADADGCWGLTKGSNRSPGDNVLQYEKNSNGVAYASGRVKTNFIGPMNYIHMYHNYDMRNSGCTAGGNLRSQCWTNRIDNTYVTWPNTLRPEPLIKNIVRQQQEENIKRYRLQDYLMFLANVENIPIGVSPVKSFIKNEDALVPVSKDPAPGGPGDETLLPTTWNANVTGQINANNWNWDVVTQTPPEGKIKFHVTLPIFSGLLGVWAEKAFPAMLISPGSFYIQIKWAKMQQAASFTMDPCRRIYGTYRDYVPSYGLSKGYSTEYRGQNLSYNRVYTIPPCTGVNHTYMAITANGATGNDFAWNGLLQIDPPVACQDPKVAGGAPFRLGTENGYLTNLFEFPRSDEGRTLGTGPFNYREELLRDQDADGVDDETAPAESADTGTGSKPPSTYDLSALFDTGRAAGAATTKYGFQFNSAIGQAEGYTTGVAKCQYVPRLNPWASGGNGFRTDIDTLCPHTAERNICFGTYLPCSTAQSRRILESTNSAISDPSKNNVPSYLITNLQFTSQQIIVPDEVTASIVRQAADSDISLDGQTCHIYKTVCAQSVSQSIILPIKLASANALYILFQNIKTQENMYYNSLSGICPFTSFQWNTTDKRFFVGSEKPPTIRNIGTTTNPFSVQLRIGNELFPQQPITNVPQLIKELVRSVHGTGDMNCSLPFVSSIRNKRFLSNTDTSNSSQFEYTSLQSDQFTIPFVPVEALDDQSITNNVLYNDYFESSITNEKGVAPYFLTDTGSQLDYDWKKITATAYNDRGTYVYPAFKPPESSFVLGFDLDTFPGQTDQARSGRYLGNAPLTLEMSNCWGLNNVSVSGSSVDPVIATAIVLHDARFSIMAGGQMTSYY